MIPREALANLRTALSTTEPCQGPDESEAIDTLTLPDDQYAALLWTMFGEKRGIVRQQAVPQFGSSR